jgi:hypothetical protein
MRTSTAANGFSGSQVIKSLGSRVLVLAGRWGISVRTMAAGALRTVQSAVSDGWSEVKSRKMLVNTAFKFLWSNALASSKCRRLELSIPSYA